MTQGSPKSRLLSVFSIGVVTAATLLLQTALTKYFSFRLWYHYAFLVISIGMLGLSASGSLTAVFRKRLDRYRPEVVCAACAGLFGLTTLLAECALALQNRLWVTTTSGDNAATFLAVSVYWAMLIPPFFFSGCVVSWGIYSLGVNISKLYAFDMVGAAMGCLLAVWVLSRGFPEQSIALSATLAFIAMLLFLIASHARSTLILPILGSALSLTLVLKGHELFSDNLTETKGLAKALVRGAKIVARSPGINGRVDVIEGGPAERFAWGLSSTYEGPFPEQRGIMIDGDAFTPITRYSGNAMDWAFAEFMPSTLPYAIGRPKRVLVIGAGGGMDLANALQHGASSVTGVEINDAIVQLMKNDFREFSGSIYDRPNVNIVHSDGRNFVENTDQSYDLIQLTLVDTFAAIASGALTLSEDFLYTLEAFRAYIGKLSPNGFLSLGRTKAEAITLTVLMEHATRGRSIDLRQQLFVADSSSSMHSLLFLYKSSPFTSEEIGRGLDFVKSAGLRMRYYPKCAETLCDPLIAKYLELPEKDDFINQYPGDIRPETDDAPFYFRESKWTQILGTYTGGRGNLLIMLAVAVVYGVVLILLPLRLAIRADSSSPKVLLAYFFWIGLGYITIEMVLIVKLTLFLGHPVRSLTVTLFSMLVSSGVGSLFTSRLLKTTDFRKLLLPLSAVIAIGLVYTLFLTHWVSAWMGSSLATRVGTSMALTAPLGFAMGMPLPIGIFLLRRRSEDLVLWGWAINGFASVVAPVIAMLAAHLLGYRNVFALGVTFYLLALLGLMQYRKDPSAAI